MKFVAPSIFHMIEWLFAPSMVLTCIILIIYLLIITKTGRRIVKFSHFIGVTQSNPFGDGLKFFLFLKKYRKGVCGPKSHIYKSIASIQITLQINSSRRWITKIFFIKMNWPLNLIEIFDEHSTDLVEGRKPLML